jgi:HEPN domain-containing protein
MTPLTRPWVRKAEADWAFVLKLKDVRPPFHDAICFHCQQAAEKYLKGLLQERGKSPRRTNDLGQLIADLLPTDPTVAVYRRRLIAITKYADDYSYSTDRVDARKALAALRAAEPVPTEIRKILGLKERKPKGS